MPSQRPRVALTLSAETYAAIFDLADAVGKPAATVVAGLLDEMVPQLEGLAKVARATKAGNTAAAKRAMTHMFGDMLAEQLIDQADMFKAKASK
jgi:hypothetical protein